MIVGLTEKFTVAELKYMIALTWNPKWGVLDFLGILRGSLRNRKFKKLKK